MKAKLLFKRIAFFVTFGSVFTIQSCRDYENMDLFPELSHLQTDSLHLEGALAISMVDTKIKLKDFFPGIDSSLWAEVDEQDMVHLRMYYKDLISIKMSDMFPGINYDTNNSGIQLPESEFVITSDPQRMKIYDKMLSGHLFFNNPKISFIIKNEIPRVTYFRMDTVNFFDFGNTKVTHAEDTYTEILAPQTFNTFTNTNFLIDTTRVPELDQAFSPVPHRIGFVITAKSPANQTLPFNVSGNETISADVDIDLPLEVRLEDLFIADTIPFTWDGAIYEQAKSATLKIKFVNGFPFQGLGQIYFADTTNFGTVTRANYIDSVFTDTTQPDIDERGWIFRSAKTDGTGYVTTPAPTEVEITLTQERIKKLMEQHASRVIIRGRFDHDPSNTVPNIYVRILGDYTLDAKIGVKLEYEGNTNDEF